MGGRGADSQSKKNKIAGLKVDLDYAIMKRKEYGTVKYGGTKKTREAFDMWSNEVRRLQKELASIEKGR